MTENYRVVKFVRKQRDLYYIQHIPTGEYVMSKSDTPYHIEWIGLTPFIVFADWYTDEHGAKEDATEYNIGDFSYLNIADKRMLGSR